jgi:hypothetical protein
MIRADEASVERPVTLDAQSPCPEQRVEVTVRQLVRQAAARPAGFGTPVQERDERKRQGVSRVPLQRLADKAPERWPPGKVVPLASACPQTQAIEIIR